jgi:gliding motility-associated-like protein
MNRIFFAISFFISLLCYSVSAQPRIQLSDSAACDSLRLQYKVSFINAGQTVVVDFGKGTGESSDDTIGSIRYDTAGIYYVKLFVDNNTIAADTDTVIISYTPNPYFTFKDQDSPVNVFEKIFTNPVQPDSISDTTRYIYIWNFGDGVIDTIDSPTHTYSLPGVYPVRLRIEDNYGCVNNITQYVSVEEMIDAPNVFTPNDDNVNDYFEVFTEMGTTLSIKIFNRNGLLVYQATSPTIRWDGTAYGSKLSTGVYYYVIETVGLTVNYKKNGFVYLIRD